MDSEELHEIFCQNEKDENYEPQNSPEQEWTHNLTTMFLNKYCENADLPTVANRVADIVVDYESRYRVRIENDDDFEVDDEIITEEEFLKNVDKEMDEIGCRNIQDFKTVVPKTQEVLINIQDQFRRNDESFRGANSSSIRKIASTSKRNFEENGKDMCCPG